MNTEHVTIGEAVIGLPGFDHGTFAQYCLVGEEKLSSPRRKPFRYRRPELFRWPLSRPLAGPDPTR